MKWKSLITLAVALGVTVPTFAHADYRPRHADLTRVTIFEHRTPHRYSALDLNRDGRVSRRETEIARREAERARVLRYRAAVRARVESRHISRVQADRAHRW